MKKIALFDLDHTIISKDCFVELVLYIFKKNPKKLIYIPYLFLEGIKKVFRIIDLTKMKSAWLLILKDYDQESLAEFSKSFVEKKILKYIKPGFLEEFRKLKENGYTTVLATASFEFYAKFIALHLEFDYFVGTEVEFADKRIIISGKNCKRNEKINRILKLLDINVINTEESVSFSDSLSDMPYLFLSNKLHIVKRGKWEVVKTLESN